MNGERMGNVAISIFRPVNQSPSSLEKARYARHCVPRQGTIKISVNRVGTPKDGERKGSFALSSLSLHSIISTFLSIVQFET